MNKKYFDLTYQQLLIYGVHLGHTFANSLMYAAWLVYSYKDNLLIMNIFKTFFVMRVGFRCFNAAVFNRGPIWFVNLDRSAGWFSKTAAYSCGEMSWTSKWVHGMIANYRELNYVYKWLRHAYSEWAYKGKNKWVRDYYNDWLQTRFSWPRAILVSSAYHSKYTVKEALYLGIPCISIVDTNVNSNKVTLAVPGNDESLECLAFYSDVVANYVLTKKFNLISQWYLLRHVDRSITFKKWLYLKYENLNMNNNILDKQNVLVKTNILHISNIFPKYFLEKNIISTMLIVFSRNLRFNTPYYNYFDFHEFNSIESNKNIKKGNDDLLSVLQSKRLWWSFLTKISLLKNRYKYNARPFLRRMRHRFVKTWKKYYFHRRRFRGRLKWNNEIYFRRFVLRYKFYKKRYLKSNSFLQDLTSRKKFSRFSFSNRFIKYFYFMKFNSYCLKSTILNKYLMSNYYLVFMASAFHRKHLFAPHSGYWTNHFTYFNPSFGSKYTKSFFANINFYKFINKYRFFSRKLKFRNYKYFSISNQQNYSLILYYKQANNYYSRYLNYYKRNRDNYFGKIKLLLLYAYDLFSDISKKNRNNIQNFAKFQKIKFLQIYNDYSKLFRYYKDYSRKYLKWKIFYSSFRRKLLADFNLKNRNNKSKKHIW